MKRCLCCAQSADDTAITCEACGEGSWSVVSHDVVGPAPEPVEPVAAVEPEPIVEAMPVAVEPVADTAPFIAEPKPVAQTHLSRAERRKHWR